MSFLKFQLPTFFFTAQSVINVSGTNENYEFLNKKVSFNMYFAHLIHFSPLDKNM
jgi:hypothetical protein